MDGIYTVASPSTSSLYGNVGCAIRELILSKFPYNYFQYMNVSTEVAFRNLRRQFGINTNNEISKRKFPQLIVQPTYQPQDQDAFMQNIPLTRNDMDIQYNLDRRYLFEIIKDFEHGWSLKFKMNRDKIEYEVSVITQTLHQQLDIYKAMMNQMTWEKSFYYTAALESVIPKTIVSYMGKLCNLDINRYPELIPAYLRHLNSLSGYPITYKVRNASATDEFFMYYHHNMVVTYMDINLDSGSKKGMLDDTYTINFKVEVDFNLPGLYILNGESKNIDKLKVSIIDKTSTKDGFDPELDEYIPLFSLSDFYNRFPQRKDGLTLYGSFLFTSEEKSDIDSADIGLLIEPDHQKAIRFHTKYGMIDETLCRVYVMKDSIELSKDDYIINWDTMKIEYRYPDPKATYRVAIYMNMEVLNNTLANPRLSGPYDQYALKDNTINYTIKKNAPKEDNNSPVILPITEPEVPIIIDTLEDTIIPEETSDTKDTDGNQDNGDTELQKEEEAIMKYYSSIFDNTIKINAEPIEEKKKTKYSSSKSSKKPELNIHFVETVDPIKSNAINTWSKIVSNAMLYNYATSIIMEDKNYTVDIKNNGEE